MTTVTVTVNTYCSISKTITLVLRNRSQQMDVETTEQLAGMLDHGTLL